MPNMILEMNRHVAQIVNNIYPFNSAFPNIPKYLELTLGEVKGETSALQLQCQMQDSILVRKRITPIVLQANQ